MIISNAGINKLKEFTRTLSFGFLIFLFAVVMASCGGSGSGGENVNIQYIDISQIQRIQYYGAGADIVWFNNDDNISSYTFPLAGPNNDQTRAVNYYGTGADGIWFTTDDDIGSYSALISDSNGNQIKEVNYQGAGADGIWFTSDDDRSHYTAYIYDDDGNRIRESRYFGSGPDGALFTDDDVISSYTTSTYAPNKKPIKRIYYATPGIDGMWFTDDDNIYSYVIFSYDADGNLTRKIRYSGSGGDGTWFTSDDGVSNYTAYAHDAEGNQTAEIRCSGPGIDNIRFTADDEISSYVTTLYDPVRETTQNVYYRNPGADGKWFTGDDGVDHYDTAVAPEPEYGSDEYQNLTVDPDICHESDCSHIINAFMAVNSADTKRVNFRKGHYSLKGPLVVRNSNTVIEAEDDTDVVFADSLQGGIISSNQGTLSKVSVRNFHLSFALKVYTGSGGHGIDIFKCNMCLVEDVRIQNASGHGIRLRFSENSIIRKAETRNNAKFGLVIEGTGKNMLVDGIVADQNGRFDMDRDIRFANINISDGMRQVIVQNVYSTNGGRSGLALGVNPGPNETGPATISVHNLTASGNLDHGLEIFCASNVSAAHITSSGNQRNGIAMYDDPDGCYSKNIRIQEVSSTDNEFFGLHIQGAREVAVSGIHWPGNKLGTVQVVNGQYPENTVQSITIEDFNL